MARAAVAGWRAGQLDEQTLGDAEQLGGEVAGDGVRHADTAVARRLRLRGAHRDPDAA